MYRDHLYDLSDNIATITLNRPDRLNAISGGMLASFSEAFREADRDRNVRAIILTGAGKGFCSGLDLKEQGERAEGQRERRQRFGVERALRPGEQPARRPARDR